MLNIFCRFLSRVLNDPADNKEFLQYQLTVIQEVEARESRRRLEQYRHELKMWDLKGGDAATAIWADRMREMKPSVIPRRLMQTLTLQEEVAQANARPIAKATPEESKHIQELLLNTCLN